MSSEATPAEAAETLRPTYQAVTYEFGTGSTILKYIQRPLSAYGKLEMLGFLAKTVNEALQKGLRIDDLFALPEDFMKDSEEKAKDEKKPEAEMTPEQLQAENDRKREEAAKFVGALATLLADAPETVLDFWCIALAVPRDERDVAKVFFRAHEDIGGMKDEWLFQIPETFYRQNEPMVRDFYERQLRPLLDRAQKFARERSASSKRSAQTTENPSTLSSTGPGPGSTPS